MNAFSSIANDLVDARLRAGVAVQFTIPTRSMLPSLAPGDQVTARGVQIEKLRVGDIVIVSAGSRWLAHRLIEKRQLGSETRFATQGDNCTEPDSLWSGDQICGIITAVKHKEKERRLESKQARWCGVIIAQLLRWRSAGLEPRPKTFFLRLNTALVRITAWLV